MIISLAPLITLSKVSRSEPLTAKTAWASAALSFIPAGAVMTERPPPRQATIVVIGSTQPKMTPVHRNERQWMNKERHWKNKERHWKNKERR